MKRNSSNCLTKPMYGGCVCLADSQNCPFAVRFGFSFRCTHPDKADFYGHVKGEYTLDELRELSRRLKDKRRSAFVEGLDEFGRKFLQVDNAEGASFQDGSPSEPTE
jgi:hypothetical protein